MKQWILAIGIASVLLLGGCGNAGNTSASQTKATTNAEIDKLVFGDMKIGNLAIGQTLESIESKYGTPDVKTIAHGNGDKEWKYNNKGFVVDGSTVWKIRVFNNFTGSTPRGIHIGSTILDVKNAYPFLRTGIDDQLFGETTDKKYNIDFMFSDGIVSQIVLTKDNPGD